ncbi:MAG: MFS transporter, partial [Alphaproteobacteria bacterium]|nr:MFS transporter [Alphaproteobacteria bacterium]
MPALRSVHYGWVIVAACLLVGMSGYGTYYSFTLFYPYLVDEFGWSRAAISGAMSLGLVTYGVFALPMGWCVDRFGPRLTIALGGLLMGGGTLLGAYVTELWHLYALYGGIAGIGMGAAWAPLVSTISRWFEDRRGLAMGIGLLGGGTGTLVMAPIVEALLDAYGWRETYWWLGIATAVVMVGGALLLRRAPADMGLEPYGAGAAAARRRANAGREP